MGRLPVVCLAPCAVAIALVTVLAAGCTSFGAAPPASSEGGLADGQSASDGGVAAEEDGGEAGVEPDLKGCPPGYPFCDDFEREDVEGANDWSLATNADTAKIATEEDPTAPSPVRALRILSTTGKDDKSYIRRSISSSTRRVRVAFAMKHEVGDKIRQLVTLEFDASQTSRKYLILHARSGGIYLAEQDLQDDRLTTDDLLHEESAGKLLAGWARYEIDFNVDQHVVTLRRGNVIVGQLDTQYDFSADITHLRVGLTYGEPGGIAGSLRFDDVGVLETAN